jgi:hypothetical protein
MTADSRRYDARRMRNGFPLREAVFLFTDLPIIPEIDRLSLPS